MLAGLLYAGSGVGLGLWLAVRGFLWRAAERPRFASGDYKWLTGAVISGGVMGPALLMFALAASSASSVSLLLNLESVFTALMAWFVFRENFDRRLMLGMSLIVCGGVILGWRPGEIATSWPAFAVAGARQQPHAQDLRRGRGQDRRHQRSGGRNGEPLRGSGLGSGPAGAGGRCCRCSGRPARLRSQPCSFRGGVAAARHCADRRLFFDRPFYRGSRVFCVARRGAGCVFLGRSGLDGGRRCAAPHRTPPTPAPARGADAHSPPYS